MPGAFIIKMLNDKNKDRRQNYLKEKQGLKNSVEITTDQVKYLLGLVKKDMTYLEKKGFEIPLGTKAVYESLIKKC